MLPCAQALELLLLRVQGPFSSTVLWLGGWGLEEKEAMHVRTGIRRNFSCIAVNRTQEISALHSYQICDPADFNQRHSGRTTVITPLGEPVVLGETPSRKDGP
jgi:hypothetical protein